MNVPGVRAMTSRKHGATTLMASPTDSSKKSFVEAHEEEQERLLQATLNDENAATAASLMAKAAMHNLDKVKEMLNMGVPIDIPDKFGWSPLMRAAYQNSPVGVEFLLQKGAWVDHYNTSGENAAHWACERGWVDVMNVLLLYGVNYNWKDEKGKTPIDRAKQNKRKNILKLIKAHEDIGIVVTGENRRKLNEIASDNQQVWAAYQEDETNQTLLHLAVRVRHLSAIEKLTSTARGINVFAVDSKGRTAYELAKQLKYKDIAESLLAEMQRRESLAAGIGNVYLKKK